MHLQFQRRMGSNRAQKHGNEIKRCFVFSYLLVYGMGLEGFNYSQIANLGSRTYSNTFWIIFGTSKKSIKSGPQDHVFMTKTFDDYKKNPQASNPNAS